MRMKSLTPLFLIVLCAPLFAADTKAPPNIVWIFTEDMNDWMGCYGDKTVRTPHIDRLAERGVRFERAYMTAGVCSASRSAIALGAMQTSLGVHNHRSSRRRVPEEVIHLPRGVKTVYQLLREGGYYVVSQGIDKNDFNFIWKPEKLYDKVGKKYDEPLWRKRAKNQPFFAQIQLKGGKNSGRSGGAAKRKKAGGTANIDPGKVRVPPYYPDHPIIRREIAHHYDTIRQTDGEVGKIVAALKADKLLGNTVIFFWSDHGMRLPRHKQWLYEGGIRVPLIVAGPGLMSGSVRTDLVSGVDITMTTLSLAGLRRHEWMEGRPLFGPAAKPRRFVVSARDRCDYTIDRVRAITTARYKYIRNFLTDRPFMQPQYRDGHDYVKISRKLYKEGKLNAVQSLIWSPVRVAEELYDLKADPHEVKNLAQSPEHAKALSEHRTILADWIKETGDKGQYPESIAGLRGVLKRASAKAVNPEYDKAR